MLRVVLVATLFTIFFATLVNAKCSDAITLEDTTAVSMIVVFWNSDEYCSLEETFILTAPSGAQVKVRLAPNPLAGRTADRIIVKPLTEGYVTRGLGEIDVPEGREGEILVEMPVS